MKLKFVDKSVFYSTFVNLTDEELEASREFVDSDYDFGDFEVMYSFFSGCMILRYYSSEAGYHFDAPFPLAENADEAAAFIAISDYCRAEAIPETVVGIDPASLDLMLRGAKKYSLAEDEDGTLAVRIITECMECEFLPETLYDDVYLGEFADSYAEKYEELLKNVNLNCHYGYNILEDMPCGTGRDFIERAREEFERSESMTFAATVYGNGKNVFVGEGTLYGFDGRGKAFAAFRVLPEYHRRGIGKKIFCALMKIANETGLEKVIAEVKPENLTSINLLSKYAAGKEFGEKTVFEFNVADFVNLHGA